MKKLFFNQLTPILLTILTFLALSTILYWLLVILSSFNFSIPIFLDFRKRDLLIGIAIYLKTAIDFAIFIGNLMHANPGWKKRIAIEIGTAVGNALGTFLVLTIWVFFKELPILMIIMIVIASMVLLRMAEESFEQFLEQRQSFLPIRTPVHILQDQLNFVNKIFRPILKFVVPDLNLSNAKKLSFINLLVFSFTIPFILGLDDFAGYIPLFTIVNIFGFSLGVMFGHMLLTMGLFAFPKITVKVVRHPIVLVIGGLIFIGIGLYGFWEVIRLIISIIG